MMPGLRFNSVAYGLPLPPGLAAHTLGGQAIKIRQIHSN